MYSNTPPPQQTKVPPMHTHLHNTQQTQNICTNSTQKHPYTYTPEQTQIKNIYATHPNTPFLYIYVFLVFFFFCKLVVFAQVLKGNKVGRSACSAPCPVGTPGKMAKPNGKMKKSHMPTHIYASESLSDGKPSSYSNS